MRPPRDVANLLERSDRVYIVGVSDRGALLETLRREGADGHDCPEDRTHELLQAAVKIHAAEAGCSEAEARMR